MSCFDSEPLRHYGAPMRKRSRILSFLWIAAALTFSACGDDGEGGGLPVAAPTATSVPSATPTPTAAPTNTPIALTSSVLLQRGPFGVGVTTLTFEDTSRPTMPNNGFPGAPTRRLITEIWYPAEPGTAADGARNVALSRAGAPYPLVAHSHGFSSVRTEPAYLARHLASYGYIVISPDFPLTNINAPGGPTIFDLSNQPGDVSFLISQM